MFFSCGKEQKLELDISNDIVLPKHYIVTKTSEILKIDGLQDELSWKSALFTDAFIDIEGIKKPKYETKTKLLWNDKFLYVYAELEEPHIWGDLKQRDTIIYFNNDFEIFIDPSGTGTGYGELEINALNTVWDLYLNKPYRTGGKANFEWNLNNLKTAVKTYGSINNADDIDSLWTIEMAIPLKPLINLKNKPKTLPKEGEQWRINFSRVQWEHDIIDGKYYRKKENGNYLKEYNWVWSNQKVINMHEPEKWGFLQFTENENSKNVTFLEDTDTEVKQVAFALFRNTLKGHLKYLLEHNYGFTQELIVNYGINKSIKVSFFKTYSGFEYKLKGNKTYIINNEGTLITL